MTEDNETKAREILELLAVRKNDLEDIVDVLDRTDKILADAVRPSFPKPDPEWERRATAFVLYGKDRRVDYGN